LKEVSGRAKLLTRATKMEEKLGGNFDNVNDGYVNSRIAKYFRGIGKCFCLNWRIGIIGRARYL
jgi:hypothetical protein